MLLLSYLVCLMSQSSALTKSVVVKVCLYNLKSSDKATVVGRVAKPGRGPKLKVILSFALFSFDCNLFYYVQCFGL